MYAADCPDYPENLGPIDTFGDQAIAQQAEEQGAVLLKNAGGQLPLNAATVKSIAIIGSNANAWPCSPAADRRYAHWRTGPGCGGNGFILNRPAGSNT